MKEKLFNPFPRVIAGFDLVVQQILQQPVAGDAGAVSPVCPRGIRSHENPVPPLEFRGRGAAHRFGSEWRNART